jgi:hypothetical protein
MNFLSIAGVKRTAFLGPDPMSRYSRIPRLRSFLIKLSLAVRMREASLTVRSNGRSAEPAMWRLLRLVRESDTPFPAFLPRGRRPLTPAGLPCSGLRRNIENLVQNRKRPFTISFQLPDGLRINQESFGCPTNAPSEVT